MNLLAEKILDLHIGYFFSWGLVQDDVAQETSGTDDGIWDAVFAKLADERTGDDGSKKIVDVGSDRRFFPVLSPEDREDFNIA